MKKKLLIIAGWAPYPLHFGGNQAVFNAVDCLKNEFDVFFIYPGNNKEATGDIFQKLDNMWGNVKILPYTKPSNTSSIYIFIKKVYKRVCAILLKNNIDYRLDQELKEEIECLDEGFLKHIHTVINQYNIDIVQTEFNQALSLICTLPKNIKKVFVHHEIRFVRNKLLLRKMDKKDSFYYNYKVEAMKTQEISFLNKYDTVITLSLEDKVKLEQEGVTTRIIPSYAIVQDKYHFVAPSKVSNIISFVGPEEHIPNKLGVEWFIDNCLEELRAEVPNIEFKIIGKWSIETKNKYKNRPYIKFVGFVEDLQAALKETIMIVPIMIGSGIRMKILEASAMGVPFVTTSVGVEGIPFNNGKECIIADTTKDFVKSIVRLRNVELCAELAQNAYKKYKDIYSLESLKKSRIKAYE